MTDVPDEAASPAGPELANFDEIRNLLSGLPGPDLGAGAAAEVHEAQLTKPAGALGRLEEIARWVCLWQGRHPPRVDHARVCVFAGNHGVAARGVSAYPADVTAQMVQNFIAGGGAVNQLAAMADADLRVYEKALEQPTADFTEGPAMARAIWTVRPVLSPTRTETSRTGRVCRQHSKTGHTGRLSYRSPDYRCCRRPRPAS